MEPMPEAGKMEEEWFGGTNRDWLSKLEMPVRHPDAREHLFMR